MKQVFAIFCAVILMPGLNAHAWVGGPWSNNNTQTTGDDGIYEAVATMSNGVGLYRWAVRNQSPPPPTATTATTGGGTTTGSTPSNVLFGGGIVGAASSNVWYYRGIVYYGPCFGVVNSAMGIVSMVANAATQTSVSEFQTSGINGVRIAGPPAGADSSPSTATGELDGDGAALPIELIPAGDLARQNIGFANSSFLAKITTKSPVKRFSGSGVISFNGVPDEVTSTLRFSGTTTPSGSAVTESINSTGGEDSSFPQRGARRTFKVIGTQVSTTITQ